jgi:hypothetical protein
VSPTVADTHRAALAALPHDAWGAYLDAHSGLPGPRGNLELLAAAGDLAPAALLRAWSASDDEYRAAVGTAGLGRLAVEGDATALDELRARANDARWRVREAVAMGLQRVGDADRSRLHAVAEAWAAGSPLEQRAAIAGVCEPRLLRAPADAARAVALVARVTAALAALPVDRRRADDVRTLRQALGYCWSVAVAADPAAGFPALEALAEPATQDADIRWVLRTNLTKARLARADADRTAALAARVART